MLYFKHTANRNLFLFLNSNNSQPVSLPKHNQPQRFVQFITETHMHAPHARNFHAILVQPKCQVRFKFTKLGVGQFQIITRLHVCYLVGGSETFSAAFNSWCFFFPRRWQGKLNPLDATLNWFLASQLLSKTNLLKRIGIEQKLMHKPWIHKFNGVSQKIAGKSLCQMALVSQR